MRPGQRAKIQAAFERVHKELDGDIMTWVDAAGKETELVGAKEDLPDTSAKEEGVRSDQAGWRSGAVKKLSFYKPWLVRDGVVIDPSGHFIIDGLRYDLDEKEPIAEDLVPLAGLQTEFQVVVRRSVELNNSDPSMEFSV
jgi:hypothetical protein